MNLVEFNSRVVMATTALALLIAIGTSTVRFEMNPILFVNHCGGSFGGLYRGAGERQTHCRRNQLQTEVALCIAWF